VSRRQKDKLNSHWFLHTDASGFSFDSNLSSLIFQETAGIIVYVNDERRGKRPMNEEERTMKRLCKSNTNKKICGVCGGIAEYLNADPTMIRLAFLLISALAGSGIAVYIIAALVMPEAREAAE
jgi:phage shock protein C